MGRVAPNKHVLAAAALALLASLVVLAIPVRASSATVGTTNCAHATESVRQVGAGKLRRAVLCLINAERRRHARETLNSDRRLRRAAAKHTEAMIEANCLSHRCPGEPDLHQRVRRSGYLKGARSWRYAENTGCALTAEAMVANWMGTTFHRINILRGKFEDVGVAADRDRVRSRCKRGYGTFTAVFAFRIG
jgi:uncharacterized protein YkwD